MERLDLQNAFAYAVAEGRDKPAVTGTKKPHAQQY